MAVTVDVDVNISVSDKTLNRVLNILDQWLEDNPDKTIVIEEEDGARVCLIAERSK